MATLDISFKAAKKLFVDTRRMQDSAERSAIEPLARWGAYVRTIAQRSIRAPTSRTPASRPGQPPRNQTGFLRRFIFWVRDPTTRSVVVGPVKLSGRKGPDVPNVLEFGGRVRRRRKGRPALVYNQLPRPYMSPALRASIPTTENLFRSKFR